MAICVSIGEVSLQIKNLDKVDKEIIMKKKVSNYELNKNVDKEFINEYFKILKLDNDDEDIDLYNEDDFKRFKENVLKTFTSNLVFPQNEKKNLQLLYITKLEPCKGIKDLCRILLRLYTQGGNYKPEILLYYVINQNLKVYNVKVLAKLKYILIALLLNYNKEFNSGLRDIRKVYRLTNIDDEILMVGKPFFSNQFLSTTVLKEFGKDDEFFNNRNTCLEIQLSVNDEFDYFSNYIDISEFSIINKEKEILICPFTKFDVVSIEKINGKKVVNLREIKENFLINNIFSFLFKVMEDNKTSKLYYDNLLIFHQRSLEIKQVKGTSLETSYIYNNIGKIYYFLGNYDQALIYYEMSLLILLEMFGENNKCTLGSLNNIGLVYLDQENNQKALVYLEKALEIFINLYGEEDISISPLYNNVGNVYLKMKELSKAETYYMKDLKILYTRCSENELSIADTLNNLGLIYSELLEFNKALEYFEKSLLIRLTLLGEHHINTAGSYTNLGLISSKKGDFGGALNYFKKSSSIICSVLGEDNKEVANSFNNMASIYRNQ